VTAAPATAMILAAGLGRRMRPITATTPKPLVEVAGRSLIEHVLDRLDAAGVREVVVNVHYLAELVEVHVRRRTRLAVTISDERGRLLDTGGAIVKALPHLGPAPFFVANSDSFWIEGTRPNLARLAATWDADAMDGLLMLAPTVGSVGYSGSGDFDLAPDGRLGRRRDPRIAPFVYCGVAVLSPALFAGAPAGPFSLNALFDRAIEAGRLYGMRMDGVWLHVGTPDAIGQAEAAIRHSAD